MANYNPQKLQLPSREHALRGRDVEMPVSSQHYVNGNPLRAPFPSNLQHAMFGLGCFWGAERLFWNLPGVYSTAVGYANGFTPNPTYHEVCSGMTGHNEVVLVIYDPAIVTYGELLQLFWNSHDPTQGMRQGNDVGTQYRSGIYTYTPEQRSLATQSKQGFDQELRKNGFDPITTEIVDAPPFYYAEDYHQQYLAKNPNGYCGLKSTGVPCPSV